MAETIETKEVRFKKVASNRVQNVIHYLDLLKNCANRSNYEYSKEDVDKMFNEISKALRDAKAAYSSEQRKQKSKDFKF